MAKCTHPRDLRRKVDTGVWLCACGARWTTITMREWAMAEQIDAYNRAQRTQASRRKYVRTGKTT